MFIALSRFTVANGMTRDVKTAFVNRPHLVDAWPGFVRLDVLSPHDCPDEIWLVTYWTDADSYTRWHRSEAHHASHAGIPRGLKLVKGSAVVRTFELVCS